MDSIGDWLYIVFLIVAGISSMINASKKKKEARKAPVPPVQPVVSKAAPQPSAAPFLIAEEKIPERAAEPTPTIAVEEEAETTESNLLTDREELRKAILYAEIMQRKV